MRYLFGLDREHPWHRPFLLLPLLGALLAADTPRKVDPQSLPRERPIGILELVATFDGPQPYGVTVSHKGRIFLCLPRRNEDVPASVVELQEGRLIPYPDAELNRLDAAKASECLISVQAAVVDCKDRLWALDMGYTKAGPPLAGGPKLVGIDLATHKVFKNILFPLDVATKKSFLNDVRFDLSRGKEGMAFISDTGDNALVVVDLATGQSWRRLADHPSTRPEPTFVAIVEGQPLLNRVGANGIAISADGKRFYYCPLASRRLYSVSVDALCDRQLSDTQVAATVTDHGEKGACGGMEADAQGRLYFANYEHNAVLCRQADGTLEPYLFDTRMLWPDTLYLATDGYMYLTCNQLNRQAKFHKGKDMREKPFSLFRFRCEGTPIVLK